MSRDPLATTVIEKNAENKEEKTETIRSMTSEIQESNVTRNSNSSKVCESDLIKTQIKLESKLFKPYELNSFSLPKQSINFESCNTTDIHESNKNKTLSNIQHHYKNNKECRLFDSLGLILENNNEYKPLGNFLVKHSIEHEQQLSDDTSNIYNALDLANNVKEEQEQRHIEKINKPQIKRNELDRKRKRMNSKLDNKHFKADCFKL
ncbi:unnamed protein product [Didymodactylos carnosus]|uniref:Uncharacterized protein n=1 Tax=Didymodactylos carnosus TaxID=1234261 RepID=A0A813UQF1_9BILA|nr:unnamed protein product [Didymodactylos carnosus]CAF1418072.1 unnamed protein product [Didymodactylos carnosus]CAF3616309.1 unnamed protein product [Didymodactylos carnosus]CAF4219850.1 unnamed protein product [Didymodactylos carnosus]